MNDNEMMIYKNLDPAKAMAKVLKHKEYNWK